jgi:hypothetical protein
METEKKDNRFLIYMLLLFTGIALGFILQRCSDTPQVVEVTDSQKEAELYTVINNANASKEYWKKQALSKDTVYKTILQKRDRIIYRTTFDTLATIDTVLVELYKCDSVKKYSDTALVNRNEKIEDLTHALTESENVNDLKDSLIEFKDKKLIESKKDITRVKANNTLKAGIIVILNIASIASPPTAIITTGLSIVVAILPFNKKSKK